MSTNDKRTLGTTAVSAEPEPDDATVDGTLRRIAHELRTPIGAIASSADIMRTEALGPLGDARYRDYADSISNSANYALNVVEQAIEDLGGENDGGNCELTELDANAVILHSVEQLQPLADDAEVIIEISLAEGEVRVFSEATKLQQIIANAAGNAIKFSPVGSRVTITSRRSGASPAVIEIVDRGLGIGAAELARIRHGAPDRGLGYRLMHRLSKLAGVQLTIDSKRGEGTRVCLALSAAGDL